MKIRITSAPYGKVPQEISEAWIGLELPVELSREPYAWEIWLEKKFPSNFLNRYTRFYISPLAICVSTILLLAIYLLSLLESFSEITAKTRMIVGSGLVILFISLFIYWIFGSRNKAYVVNMQAALDILAKNRPDAADWWRKNHARSIQRRRNIAFNVRCCQLLDTPTEQ